MQEILVELEVGGADANDRETLNILSGVTLGSSFASMAHILNNAPVAISYAWHLRVFPFIWLFLLPFTFVESISWGTPLILAFITYGIVGVELNAEELENPFDDDEHDIDLNEKCDEIQEIVRNIHCAAEGGYQRYVRNAGLFEPPPGEQFWLDELAPFVSEDKEEKGWFQRYWVDRPVPRIKVTLLTMMIANRFLFVNCLDSVSVGYFRFIILSIEKYIADSIVLTAGPV